MWLINLKKVAASMPKATK